MSHTYSVLEVSQAVYDEIRKKLEEAGYEHAFHDDLIDMHGIAVKAEDSRPRLELDRGPRYIPRHEPPCRYDCCAKPGEASLGPRPEGSFLIDGST